jgi:hypothetical protein
VPDARYRGRGAGQIFVPEFAGLPRFVYSRQRSCAAINAGAPETRPTDELVGNAAELAVDKPSVCILLLSNLRERNVRRDVVIEAIPMSWSLDFQWTF